ncbi:hypothetical protein, partial [Treponema endosymbiont of Eucomonympha sp.]|uniref:hypothetical protein n=1 Tax=Treponema endosymbiont of Eucomonympha sp. TaxID=1580831 RepID=UPI000B17F3CA
MSDFGTKEFCGLTFNLTGEPSFSESSLQVLYCLENVAFGTLDIADDVIKYCNDRKEVQYKILSLLYEQHILSVEKNFAIVLREEQRIKWTYPQCARCFTVDELLGLFPENIMEIQSHTILNLARKYPDYGQEVADLPYYCFFAKDEKEQDFIIDAMFEKNWLSKIDGIHTWPLKITVTGWLEIESTLKRTDSKNVFVAMMFDEKTNEAWSYMQKAISELGFNPLRIDKVEFNDEINGQILLNIKQSAFVVADITGHRNGVYFEDGFAMALKKDVIFACSEVDFEKKHFDVSHYNIIKWKDEQDLYEKLKDRIQG